MTDDSTKIPAGPVIRKKQKKYKKVDDDETSAFRSLVGSGMSQAGSVVTKVVHIVTRAANGSSKKEEDDRTTDSEPKLKDEAAANSEDKGATAEEYIGDESDSKTIASVSKVMSATKKTLSMPLKAGAKATKKVTAVVSAMNRSKSSHESEYKVIGGESTLSMDENDGSTVEMTNLRYSRQSSQRTEVFEAKSAATIYMGPVLAFLFHDATIAIGTSLVIAAYPTISNYHLIVENQIPLSVTVTWILVAFAAGYDLALLRTLQVKTGYYEDELLDSITIPSEIDVPAPKLKTRKGYSVLRSVSMKLSLVKVEFSGEKALKRVWSSLEKSGKLKPWQSKAYDPVNEGLQKRLLRNPMYRRRSPAVITEQAPSESQPSDQLQFTKIGGFDLAEADSLKGAVIDPLFVLRGMDVFLTEHREEGAEDNMGEHPFLIRNGLRDTPSFVVNILTQWANILIYFQMPKWVQDWDNIVEQDDDPDDVKALKKFLNGDDEYRNLRLKMLPSLVDGPMPIRMVAPPKREMTIHCSMLPARWRTRDACHKNGRFLHPCLELELDVMAHKAMRGMASLVKRYLKTMSVDVAVTIDKPDHQIEDELSACVGMFRFDQIDVSSCPQLPERIGLGHSLQADTIRASVLMQSIDPSAIIELQSLPEAQEVGA